MKKREERDSLNISIYRLKITSSIIAIGLENYLNKNKTYKRETISFTNFVDKKTVSREETVSLFQRKTSLVLRQAIP